MNVLHFAVISATLTTVVFVFTAWRKSYWLMAIGHTNRWVLRPSQAAILIRLAPYLSAQNKRTLLEDITIKIAVPGTQEVPFHTFDQGYPKLIERLHRPLLYGTKDIAVFWLVSLVIGWFCGGLTIALLN